MTDLLVDEDNIKNKSVQIKSVNYKDQKWDKKKKNDRWNFMSYVCFTMDICIFQFEVCKHYYSMLILRKGYDKTDPK